MYHSLVQHKKTRRARSIKVKVKVKDTVLLLLCLLYRHHFGFVVQEFACLLPIGCCTCGFGCLHSQTNPGFGRSSGKTLKPQPQVQQPIYWHEHGRYDQKRSSKRPIGKRTHGAAIIVIASTTRACFVLERTITISYHGLFVSGRERRIFHMIFHIGAAVFYSCAASTNNNQQMYWCNILARRKDVLVRKRQRRTQFFFLLITNCVCIGTGTGLHGQWCDALRHCLYLCLRPHYQQ